MRFEFEQQGKSHGGDESKLIYSVYGKKINALLRLQAAGEAPKILDERNIYAMVYPS